MVTCVCHRARGGPRTMCRGYFFPSTCESQGENSGLQACHLPADPSLYPHLNFLSEGACFLSTLCLFLLLFVPGGVLRFAM